MLAQRVRWAQWSGLSLQPETHSAEARIAELERFCELLTRDYLTFAEVEANLGHFIEVVDTANQFHFSLS